MERTRRTGPSREVIEAAVEEMRAQGAEVVEIEEASFLELLDPEQA